MPDETDPIPIKSVAEATAAGQLALGGITITDPAPSGPPPAAGPRWRWRVSDKMFFVASNFLVQGLRIVTTFAMARILTKADYGIVAFSTALPSVISNFGDLGVARAMVQFHDEDQRAIEDAGFAISLGMGVLSLVASVGAGVYLALQSASWQRVPMGLMIGVTTMLSFVYQFQMACLNRDLRFRAEAWQNVLFMAVSLVTGIGMALMGMGVYALLAQPLASQMLSNVAMFRHHRLRVPRAVRWAPIRRILGFGWRITLAGYVGGLQATALNLFIGFSMGQVPLGVFGRATQVRDLFGYNLNAALDRMLYPLMRTSSNDLERQRSILRRGIAASMLLCAFGAAMLEAIAPEMVRLVLGPQWTEVPRLLRILAPVLLTTPFMITSIAVANGRGRPEVWLKSGVVALACLAVGLPFARFWGLTGIAITFALAQSAGTCYSMAWARREIAVRARILFDASAPVVAASAVSLAAMLSVRALLGLTSSRLAGVGRLGDDVAALTPAALCARATVTTALGIAAYLAATWLLARPLLLDARSMVRVERGAGA
jgi:PST family polysaccharide transporter